MSDATQIRWPDFLEKCPPGQKKTVSELWVTRKIPRLEIPLDENSVGVVGENSVELADTITELSIPEIQLDCDSDRCDGLRFFDGRREQVFSLKAPRESAYWERHFLIYRCRNCKQKEKVFAVAVLVDPERSTCGEAIKIGELPPFGPRLSSHLISLIGPDRDLFIKGRRAESLGLGMAAFTYYRRIVENQKNRLLDEIIKVATRANKSERTIEALEAAKRETQFSRAVDSVKKAIPSNLDVNGQNPLTLLHRALSQGIHEHSDDKCLALAASIRLILSELADRLHDALKEQVELHRAVAQLLQAESSEKRANRQERNRADPESDRSN